ncbi:MAG: hypothetical protein ACHP7E_06480, partial [Burkholderiales bacterium]
PVPGDPDFEHAHGLRLGVSALTTRGMSDGECEIVAGIVADTARALAAGLPPPAGAADPVRSLCRRSPQDHVDAETAIMSPPPSTSWSHS